MIRPLPIAAWGTCVLSLVVLVDGASAAASLEGGYAQTLNVEAVVMFFAFVAATLVITKWAANRTRSAADFYAAAGKVTGAQNGLAIAGDYMSAASFLGITGLVFSSGFDGLIYSVGWLVGWPIVLFLIAERLRNLGKYTFADVTAFRLAVRPIRTLSAIGTLAVVAFYLIAQMVGAGKLIELLFGLPYVYAEILVGALMITYVAFGGMVATSRGELQFSGAAHERGLGRHDNRGALAGGFLGLGSALMLVILSPAVWVTTFGFQSAPFPYDNPALFSMSIAFLGLYIFSKLDGSSRAEAERALFDAQFVRSETGLGAMSASGYWGSRGHCVR